MESPIIKLENVNFFYDKGKPSEVHALENINLGIKQGEYVVFFGPSGCGKSTLLYAIAGIELPSSGKVIINNQNLMDFLPRELAIYRQIGVGIIFQNFNLIPSIKVIDNVILPMAFLGISPSKRQKRAMEVFERLGIANLVDRFPFELSGGQQQRVGVARALVNDPPLILADEPIGNLDSVNAANVLDLLKELNVKDKKTIIMVTHEAWSLRDANRVFYMKDRVITKVEERKTLIARKVNFGYYYETLFSGLPTVEARAKTLSSLILRGYSQVEIKRLEYFLMQRFKNAIDKDVFRMVLDRPFRDGGVGLWKQRAKKIADYVEMVMIEEKELEQLYKKIETNPEAPLVDEVKKVRQWLLEGTKTKLTPFQIDCLDEAIGERIKNIITADNFRKVLDLSRDSGGVGFKIGTSFKMAEKLEVILGRAN